MNADVQRAQALGHYPLQVSFGEPGQGGEVPVEERQPVVVVLHVQAATESGRKLINEAEFAVVVASANPVKQGAIHLNAQGAPGRLFYIDLALQPSGIQSERDRWLVDEQLILDDVARDTVVDGQDPVARDDAGQISGRSGGDGDDHRGRHSPKATDVQGGTR